MIKIKIWGNITEKTSSLVENAVSSIIDEEEPVILVINSSGGIMNDAIIIYNLLSGLPNPLITVTMGKCFSAATLIFNCGKKRYITKHSEYMIHQPSLILSNAYNFSEIKKVKNHLAYTLNIFKKYYLNNNINIPKKKLDYAFKYGNDLYLNYKECLKYDIATNVFKSWNELLKKEHIDTNKEKILLFEVSDNLIEEE